MSKLLHSTILGEGAPLLILHGFLGMSDNWKTLGNRYAAHSFQVHLIDQRNHGRSFHDIVFDYDALAADLRNYIAHYGLEKSHLLGHSMGGKTAMQFAVDYTDAVHKLIVADIAPKYYPPHHQDIIAALLQLDFNQLNSRSEADKQLAVSLPDFGIRQFLLKNLYWKEKGKLDFRFNLDILQHKLDEIGEPISPSSTFQGPTLFLRGSRSEYVHPNDITLIQKHFPIAKVETVENAGHWLHAENPAQFFEKSIAFLDS
ncbi:MAG: alpha/beta fold hydrolase [Bacteroidota bacterium]